MESCHEDCRLRSEKTPSGQTGGRACFGGLLRLGRFGLGPGGVEDVAFDLAVRADADVVGRLGLQVLQGRPGGAAALDDLRLGTEEIGVGAVGDLVTGVQAALFPGHVDLALARGQLRNAGGLQDDPEAELAGAGEIALAGDGDGGGPGVCVVLIADGVVRAGGQGLRPQLHRGGGGQGFAGIGRNKVFFVKMLVAFYHSVLK